MVETYMNNFITLTTYIFKIIYNIYVLCRGPGFYPWVRNIPWRRKWQPTPILLPGKSHGWRSLVGYSPWGHKESDTTEDFTFFLSEYIHIMIANVYTYIYEYMIVKLKATSITFYFFCREEFI